MKKTKEVRGYKGITLIALVITIIVLLILAGVSIATLTGDNGILTRVSGAKETQRGSEIEEIVLLTVNENQIASYSDNIKKTKTDVVNELFTEGKLTEEEKNKLLGLNGETEVDKITIGNIEVDFSKLNTNNNSIPKDADDEKANAYALILANNAMIFVREDIAPVVGEIYESETYGALEIAAVYADIETTNYDYDMMTDEFLTPPGWIVDENYSIVTSVVFEDYVAPISTCMFFAMFENCTSINMSKLDTSNVTNMFGMYMLCTNLTSLDLSDFNTSKVTNMVSMFSGCNNLTSLNLSSFDTSNVTYMGGMFSYCENLKSLDVSKFDTSNVSGEYGMNYMFGDCSSLTSMDLSNFDTSNVKSMDAMFSGCNSLTSLDLSNFDTSNVKSMHAMFSNCKSLTSLDLSSFDTSNVTSMSEMFYKCEKLTNLNVSSFDTSNVDGMYYMFGVCESLTSLDVSNFNTEKVESMGGMFYCCRNIKVLDLSSFDTSNVTNMGADGHTQGMFELCDNLTTIYASELWSVENVTISERMFFNCFNLVGKVAYGEGTGGDLENANYETGYLTYKAAPTKE